MNKKHFAILNLFILSIFLIKAFIVYAPSSVTGRFIIDNDPPGPPSEMRVQQFLLHIPEIPTDFDYFDSNDDGLGVNISNTHMVYIDQPSLRWRIPEDPNNDPIRTLICISTSKALRDSVNGEQFDDSRCDVVNKYTKTTGITGIGSYQEYNLTLDDTKFVYNAISEEVTFFVRMIGFEDTGQLGALFSTAYYDANITIKNSRPYDPISDGVNPPAVATHSRYPVLNWLPNNPSLDPDDGNSPDHYPKDRVTYVINITDFDDRSKNYLYLSVIGDSIYNGPWPTALNYSTIETSPGRASKTYLINIEAKDRILPSAFNYTSTLVLYDNIPKVQYIEMGNDPGIDIAYKKCPNFCTLTPLQQSNVTSMQINVVTTEDDNDCNIPSDVNVNGGNFTVYVHLCTYSSGLQCNENFNNFTFKLDQIKQASNIKQCNFTFTAMIGPNQEIGANKVAFPGTIPFYIPPAGGIYGDPYLLYINVTSQANVKRASDLEATTTWNYDGLESVIYKDSLNIDVTEVTLGGSPTTLGVFNPGVNEYNFTNIGNIITDFQWQATNPRCDTPGTCGTMEWDISDSSSDKDKFLIDDEPNIEFLAGLPETGLEVSNITNPSYVYFNFTTGLQRCIAPDCSSPTVNQKMPTHFHINPPIGLQPGTYASTITYTLDSRYRNQHV